MKNEMGLACGTHRGEESHLQIFETVIKRKEITWKSETWVAK